MVICTANHHCLEISISKSVSVSVSVSRDSYPDLRMLLR